MIPRYGSEVEAGDRQLLRELPVFLGLAGEEVPVEGVGLRVEASGKYGHGGIGGGGTATRVGIAEDQVDFLLRNQREADQEGEPAPWIRCICIAGSSPKFVDEALQLLVALFHGWMFRLRDMGSPRENWAEPEVGQSPIQCLLGADPIRTALDHEPQNFPSDRSYHQQVLVAHAPRPLAVGAP